MSMRKSVRSELKMLREFAHVMMPQIKCHFCGKPLMTLPKGTRFGNNAMPPVKVRVTTHHVNGNHDHNQTDNLRPVHTVCHKRFHAALTLNGKYRGQFTKNIPVSVLRRVECSLRVN